VQIRHVARFLYGESLPAESRADGDVPVFGSNGQVGLHDRPISVGPTIIVGRKGSHGRVQYSSVPVFAIDTTYFIDSTMTSADLRWLYYALSNTRLDRLGQDVGVPGLNREAAHSQRIPLPSLDEQRAIADFLDAETARIDAIITKKRRLIELLGERRTTLITSSVVGPAGRGDGLAWATVALKQLASLNTTCVSLGERPYIALESVQSWTGELIDEGGVEERGPGNGAGVASVEPGDVLFGKLRPYLAKSWVVDRPAYASTELLSLRPAEGTNSRFLGYLTRSRPFVEWAVATSEGTKMPRTSWEKVGDYRLQVPGSREQRAIADFLDTETTRIDALIAMLGHQLELLAEHRQALITAAVTGELDVAREIAEEAS